VTTERIDIVIREDGSRVVKRNIEDIGASAQKTDSALQFLKRTLGGIAFGLIVRETFQLIDSFTSLQNKLRGVGIEGQTLTQVYKAILRISDDTRSSLEGTATIYSRLALNSRELGTSQQELLNFTKTLNQAIILSGATTQEASGALIQFSQGMASGTLRGDELRSVLEQLPIVADIIGRQLGVTRGELRKFGQEGKITSQVILEAFKNAAPELERSFSRTIPTMSQAFQVLKNNFVDFIGRADQAAGVSRAIAQSLIYISKNLDFFADSLRRATIALATAGAVYATVVAAIRVNVWLDAAAATLAYARAVSAGTVVTLGSAAAEDMRAAHAAAGAAAQVSAAAAIAAAQASAAAATFESAVVSSTAQALQTTAARVSIETVRQSTIARIAAVQVERQSLLATIAAAEAAGAQSFALATKRTAIVELASVETTYAALVRELVLLDARRIVAVEAQTVALADQAKAQSALNAAQARAAVSQGASVAASAAATTATAAASAAGAVAGTGLIAQALAKVKDAFSFVFGLVSRFFALINSNPFTVLIVGLVAATGLLLGFGDKIDAGIDGITNMQDVLRALAAYAQDAFSVVKEYASSAFNGIAQVAQDALSAITGFTTTEIAKWLSSYADFYSDVGSGFAGVVRGIAKTFDAIAGLITGLLIGIGRAITGLPELFKEVFNRVYNAVVGTVEDMINMVLSGINKLRAFIGNAPIELVKFTRQDVDAKVFEQYGQNISESITAGFEAQGGFMLDKVNNFFDRASTISKNRAKDLFIKSEKESQVVDLTQKGPPAKVPDVPDKGIDKMRNALRALLDTIIPAEGAFLDLEKAAKTLDDAVAHLGLSQADSNRYFQLAIEHYNDIIFPIGKLNRELDEQIGLLRLTAQAREVEAKVIEQVNAAKKRGEPLDEAGVKAIRERYLAIQQLNNVVTAQDSILENSVRKRQAFAIQLIAIQNLLADPTSGFEITDVAGAFEKQFEGTKEGFAKQIAETKQFYSELEQLKQNGLLSDESLKLKQGELQKKLLGDDLFAGTQEAMDFQIAQFQNMYAQIDLLRNADLISEQQAAQARAKIAVQEKQLKLSITQELFGTLSSLQSSSNKKIAAIGKAAAITQATIDGVLAVQKALASYPPPYNYAIAAAVGVTAAANVAKIAGFEEGGYTGNVGRKTPAGIVHGNEFVVNADATAEYRLLLERINAGLPLGNGFMDGGFVQPVSMGSLPKPSATAPSQQNYPVAGPTILEVTNMNILDDSIVEEYMNSPKGERVVINVMKRNSDTVRNITQNG
jgi:tape measure domain-containing protein